MRQNVCGRCNSYKSINFPVSLLNTVGKHAFSYSNISIRGNRPASYFQFSLPSPGLRIINQG